MKHPDDVTVSRTDLLSLLWTVDNSGPWTNEAWAARCRLKLEAERDPDEGQVD